MKRVDGHRCDACRNTRNRCEACRAARAAVVRAKRERYKSLGLCTECGRKAQPGETRCKPCAKLNSEHSSESAKRRRRAAK